MTTVRVRVPATSANLGPGFDCLGLAFDLWNEAEFELAGEGIQVEVKGEGAGRLPENRYNLIARMALHLYETIGAPPPPGLRIRCLNRISPGAGLGSSAAAVLTGLIGANELMGNPAAGNLILKLAVEAEGHPDNVAAALFGGLVVSTHTPDGLLTYRIPNPPVQAVVVTPDFNLPTRVARRALPRRVELSSAVYNLGRTALVVEAFRTGDLELLGRVMDDRLHQPYRFPLIPGAVEAAQAAKAAGAKAVALSGAGPSLVAFAEEAHDEIGRAMALAFAAHGLNAAIKVLRTTDKGANEIPTGQYAAGI